MARRLTSDARVRLAPFVEAGLVAEVPTTWQLAQGQLEMLLYVILPDAADTERYGAAPLGHPLARTPLLVWEIGFDHFRAGHGLGSSPEGLYKHLSFVYHSGFPTYDLQLIQTVPDGLAEFRAYTQEIQDGRTARGARLRKRIDLVIPNADRYREHFLEPGGWIDRAEAMTYPGDEEIPSFLRPEFSSLVGFVNHCARAYPAKPLDTPPHRLPGHLTRLLLARLGDERVSAKPAA